MTRSTLLLFLSLVFGCTQKSEPTNLDIIDTKVLCSNCQSPNLHVVNETEMIISYIKQLNDSLDQLMIVKVKNGNLEKPQKVVSGDNWFVNWADIPSVVSMDRSGVKLMAHWLQMRAAGTYDYDVRCAISKDAGLSWGESFVLHDDGIAAEHGFVTTVSMIDGAFVTWLDGRNTKTLISSDDSEPIVHEHGGPSHDHGGTLPMTLRASWIDIDGQKTQDLEIDNRVCDCCQTDAVITNSGAVVVYRDRSEDEVRDISIARYENDEWTHKKVHNDNWKIAGCPVNGPAISYKNGLMAIAWYTELNGNPKVYLTTSYDDGLSFNQPILIDGDQPLGRVDVVIGEGGEVVVTWLTREGDGTFIKATTFKDEVALAHDFLISDTAETRSSGFPILELIGDQLVMVRTKVESEILSVELVRMNIK